MPPERAQAAAPFASPQPPPVWWRQAREKVPVLRPGRWFGGGRWTLPEQSFAGIMLAWFSPLGNGWTGSLVLGAALLLAAGAALAVCGMVGRRRQGRQRQALSALEAERARIARDMHDELGAGVTRIKLLSELIEREVPSPTRAFGHARRISRIAAELAQSMDEIVWSVNPEKDRLEHLVSYLGAFTEELLGATHLGFRLDFPEHVPDIHLPPEVRHHLFLAVKEALNNAIKHSHATTVTVGLALAGDRLEISVRDDGRGLDTGSLPGDRNGLRNLRQRLKSIGGDCAVESQPGAGTTVRLGVTLPANLERGDPAATRRSSRAPGQRA
jgi:signal transduction histidine kinase